MTIPASRWSCDDLGTGCDTTRERTTTRQIYLQIPKGESSLPHITTLCNLGQARHRTPPPTFPHLPITSKLQNPFHSPTVFWRSIFSPPLLPPGIPALAPPAMPALTLSHVSCAFPSGHGSDRHACGRLLQSRPRPRVVIWRSPPDACRRSYGSAVARPFRTASAPPRVVVRRSPPHASRRPRQ